MVCDLCSSIDDVAAPTCCTRDHSPFPILEEVLARPQEGLEKGNCDPEELRSYDQEADHCEGPQELHHQLVLLDVDDVFINLSYERQLHGSESLRPAGKRSGVQDFHAIGRCPV